MNPTSPSPDEVLLLRIMQVTLILQFGVGCTWAVSAFRRARCRHTWSALAVLTGSVALHSDYVTAWEDRLLSGVEAPLIEPWFFTYAFIFGSIVFSVCLTARAMIHRTWTVPIFAVGAGLQLLAVLNGGHFYFFVPKPAVSIFVISLVVGLLAIAILDLSRASPLRKSKQAQPGATDNPDDAQRLREDH